MGIAAEDEGVAAEDEDVASEDEGVASEDEGVASEDESLASIFFVDKSYKNLIILPSIFYSKIIKYTFSYNRSQRQFYDIFVQSKNITRNDLD